VSAPPHSAVASERLAALADARYPIYELHASAIASTVWLGQHRRRKGRPLVRLVSGSFAMSGESLLVILLVGLVAGWLAGQIVRGTGFGIVADICIGIIGAFIGAWLLPRLGIHLGAGIVAAIISATIGALVLLVILRLVRGRGRW
jgi:uncharacterized membrane protein YeaQ/YmgE (transglycosylase-associated protein family)